MYDHPTITISEFVAKLQAIQSEHGDLPVQGRMMFGSPDVSAQLLGDGPAVVIG